MEVVKTEPSFFDKLVRFWEMIKEFFKNLPKRVSDFFWKHFQFFKGLYRGFGPIAMASFLASLNWIVRIGGSAKSNILTFYDLNHLNSLGNPRWWCRYDGPHPNVPFAHININPKISGVPDPHFLLSELQVGIAEFFGPILKFLNDIAPYLIAVKIAIDTGRIAYSVSKDYKNGSTRNTIKTVLEILFSTIGGVGGFQLGSFLGTMILPGIGTILGGLLIGILAAVGLGMASDKACDWILDYFKWDIYNFKCETCHQFFENRRYEDGDQAKCTGCRKHDIEEVEDGESAVAAFYNFCKSAASRVIDRFAEACRGLQTKFKTHHQE